MSDFNENSFEKIKENQERIKVFTVLGKSMFDVIKPNTDVLVREMDTDYDYKVGEIVVAKKNGIKFIHRIEKILLVGNKQYFVTKGTNNQYFDKGFITEGDILGVADLSDEAFVELQERIEQRTIERDIAYGMSAVDNILTDAELSTAEGVFIESILRLFPPGFIQTKDQLSQIIFGNKNDLTKFLENPDEQFSLQIKIQLGTLRKDQIKTITRKDISQTDYYNMRVNFPKYIGEYNTLTIELTKRVKEEYTRLYFENQFGESFVKDSIPEKYVEAWKKAGGDPNKISPLDGYSDIFDLAFEYHGPHHDDGDQKKIDKIKEEACRLAGINLIILTYKDDKTKFQEIIIDRYKQITGVYPPSAPALIPSRVEAFVNAYLLWDFKRNSRIF